MRQFVVVLAEVVDAVVAAEEAVAIEATAMVAAVADMEAVVVTVEAAAMVEVAADEEAAVVVAIATST